MTIFESLDQTFFPGFERRFVDVGDGAALTLTAGSGPALLFLHGDPQTHLCWHKIAPAFTDRYTVVLTDIRGRGESHKPRADNEHVAYTKRAMADEQMRVMATLDFREFAVVGHDRGARVARRMALDFPDRITKLAVMDIVPALDFYAGAGSAVAQDYFYFFFLTQPHPLPETLIGGDAKGFMATMLGGLGTSDAIYDPQVLDAYVAASSTREAVIAMCECFRAGFHMDRAHDRADREAGRRIKCPTQVYWGTNGVAGRHFDMQKIWRGWAEDVRFQPVPTGHFIPEEAPVEVTRALSAFLGH